MLLICEVYCLVMSKTENEIYLIWYHSVSFTVLSKYFFISSWGDNLSWVVRPANAYFMHFHVYINLKHNSSEYLFSLSFLTLVFILKRLICGSHANPVSVYQGDFMLQYFCITLLVCLVYG